MKFLVFNDAIYKHLHIAADLSTVDFQIECLQRLRQLIFILRGKSHSDPTFRKLSPLDGFRESYLNVKDA